MDWNAENNSLYCLLLFICYNVLAKLLSPHWDYKFQDVCSPNTISKVFFNNEFKHLLTSLSDKSALLMYTIILFIPTCFARSRCSLVWGISPSSAATTKIAPSICEAPEIMFFMKSACPGQSVCAYFLFFVLYPICAALIVIPTKILFLKPELFWKDSHLNEPIIISVYTKTNFS